MAEKKGNSKIVWIILFSIITVILCYLFVVVYFYFISPYNISLKIGFWPFVSDEAIGEMYADATVQINYEATDENFEQVSVSVVGVNVKKDGYILAPLSEFSDYSELTQITIFTNSGTAYNGELLYSDKNYNIAVFKCLNIDGSDKKIRIPYVKIGDKSDYSAYDDVILISSTSGSKAVISGAIEDTDYVECVPKLVDGVEVYDYTVSYGFIVSTGDNYSFAGGAVFDTKGKLLGFCFGELLETNLLPGEYFIQPAYGAKYFLEDIVDAQEDGEVYQNDLLSAVCGFDNYEATFMVDHEQGETGSKTFYFDRAWNPASTAIEEFSLSGGPGFYLFKEFDFEGNVIPANSVIQGVKIGNESKVDVDWRVDLIDALYSAESGDRVLLTYTEEGASSVKTLSFTV